MQRLYPGSNLTDYMVPPPRSQIVMPVVGERYSASAKLSQLIAPPYDVIESDARDVYARRSEHNIVHLTLPIGDGDRYASAARMLTQWRSEGVLVQDDDPCVYVLRQEFEVPGGESHRRTGLIAAVAVEPYEAGVVKPHEKTHAEPKADRLALLRATRTMFECLLFVTRDESGRLQRLLADATGRTPWSTFELDGVTALVWRVVGGAAGELGHAAGDALYIADGHHRYETACAYRTENPAADRTVGLIVPLGDPGLVVLPCHRILHGSALDPNSAVEVWRQHFTVQEISSDHDEMQHLLELGKRETACIVALRSGRVFALAAKESGDVSEVASEPDVARLDSLVVQPLVAAAGEGCRVEYTSDSASLLGKVNSGDAVAGVVLSPTPLEQVLAVADAGSYMPQKSTYFFPKVPSGVVMLGYD